MSTGYSPLRRWLRANELAQSRTRTAAMGALHEIARLSPDFTLFANIRSLKGPGKEDWLNWEYARMHLPGRDCDYPERPCEPCEADPRILLGKLLISLGADPEDLDEVAGLIASGRMKIRNATPADYERAGIKGREFRRNEDGTFSEVNPEAQSPR